MNITSLFNKCAAFAKMAFSGHSVKENTNPLLKSLSDAKDFEDAVEIAKEKFDYLGKGSARTVFKINDKLVLKMAHNEKGQSQNIAEMDPKAQRPCTNKILLADAKGKWIIVANNKTITEKRFKEIIGFGFESFINGLFYKFNNEDDSWKEPRDYENLQNNDLFKCIANLILDCDLQIGDLSKISSWCEVNNKVVLRDTGLTRKVFRSMYNSSETT